MSVAPSQVWMRKLLPVFVLSISQYIGLTLFLLSVQHNCENKWYTSRVSTAYRNKTHFVVLVILSHLWFVLSVCWTFVPEIETNVCYSTETVNPETSITSSLKRLTCFVWQVAPSAVLQRSSCGLALYFKIEAVSFQQAWLPVSQCQG